MVFYKLFSSFDDKEQKRDLLLSYFTQLAAALLGQIYNWNSFLRTD